MTIENRNIRRRSHIGKLGRLLTIALPAALVIPLVSATGPAASGAAARNLRACTWTIVPSPSPGTIRNTLFGATGAAGGQVWAVGARVATTNRMVAPIVEHWNGSAWSVQVMPGRQSNLLGIYAPSPASVWAVGFFIIELDHTLPVIDHFNGVKWVMAPSPRIHFGVLSGIAGTSGKNIWAVGRILGRPTVTLTEHYNGRAWTRVPSPSPPKTDYIDFGAITVVSGRDIWVAGDYTNSRGTFRTLIEHYDGHAWTIVPSPNIGPGNNYLSAIAARGPRDVWAVGRVVDGTRSRPLALNWNGHAWKARTLPAAGTRGNSLNGLTVGPDHSLWAVGSATSGNGSQRTLTEQYLHGHWRVVPSPNANKANNVLYAAAVTGGHEVWAVGGWHSPSQGKTITMRRCQR